MKLLNKIVGAALGLTMAIGVGVGTIGSHQEPVPAHAATSTYTITLNNLTGWTSTQGAQTGTSGDFTIESDNAAANTQIRLYAGGTHTITCTTGNITKAIFTCTANGTSNYGPGKMTGIGYTASSGKTGTWEGDASSFTLTGGQSRVTSIEITYEASHVHSAGTPVVENNINPTCTEDGGYDTVTYCTDCGAEITREHTVVPATGHNFEDGVCTICGAKESEYHLEYAAGTNGSECTVNGHDGIKVGTSKADGDMSITIPTGVSKIKFYIAAWKGTSSGNVTLGGVVNDTLDINADDGISNNSPFTLVGNEISFKVELNVSSGTLTITSGSARRFVVWGATDKFASEFETAWGYLTCDATGTTAPTIGGGHSWSSFKGIYNLLDAEEQSIIQANNAITARYDYIVGKYSYENFMHRSPTPIGNSKAIMSIIGLEGANNAAIIVIITLVSISAIAGYLLIRKCKETY